MTKAPFPANESARLAGLGRFEILDTPAERMFDDVTALAAQICGTPMAFIGLADANRQWCKSKVGLEVTELSRAASFCAHAIQGRDIFEVPDALADGRFSENPLVPGDPKIRYYGGAPLIAPGGHCVGTLCVMDYVPRHLTKEQREGLARLGRQVVALLEPRQTNQLLARQTAFQERLLACAGSAIISTTPEGVITHFNPAAEQMLGYAAAEMIGQVTPEVFHDPAEVEARALELSREPGREIAPGFEVFVAQARFEREETREWTYVRKDGSRFPVLLSVSAIRDGEGKVTGFLGIAQDLTARKLAEAQLATLGHAVESTSEMICITDLQDRFLFVNRAFLQTYGYSAAEILGQIPEILYSPNVPPPLIAEIRQQTRLGGWRGEVDNWRKDGTEFPIALSTSLVKDGAGRVIGLMGVAQDISDRRQADAKVRASEAKFRELFESAPIAIALHATDKRILNTNEAYQRMLGYTNDEIRQLEVQQITHPEDLAEGRRWFGELVDGKLKRYQREKRYLRKDGSLVWGQCSVSVLGGGCGERQIIISMVEDITQRRAAVEALKESERNLRLIAENATDVIFAFDMNRRPLFINAAVQELTGHSFAEIQREKFINWIHPADQERMLRHWEELYAGKSYTDVEFRLVTKTGQTKWCSSTWGPTLDEKGGQIGVQGRERDITQRKELERQILQIAADERRRIGHDLHDGLGQWLAGIALMTKTLEMKLLEEKSTQLAMAKEVVAMLGNAIVQARNLAHSFDPVHVEANGLVAALGKLAANSASLFGVACGFKCNEKRLTVNAQAGLALYRITQEAIHNAIQHGKARRIEVELESGDIQFCLRIRDNGNGFSPQPGSPAGMGLRIMHYRANSIQGNLRITSEPDKGTQIECFAPKQVH